MKESLLSVLEQHDAINSLLTDDVFDSLKWSDVSAGAFSGFYVKAVEYSPSPDGVAIFYGIYPLMDENALFALAVFYSDDDNKLPSGLRFQRARINDPA